MLPSKVFVFVAFLSVSFFFSSPDTYALSVHSSAEQTINKSAQDLDEILLNVNNQHPHFVKKLGEARGVVSCPEIIETSTLFSRFLKGKCVLLSRDSQNGWSAPAFYNLSQEEGFDASLNKQDQSEIFFFIMTQKALEAFVDRNVVLKKNKTLSTISLKKDILSLKMPDLYLAKLSHHSLQNISTVNMKISYDDLMSKKYYQASVNPMDILLSMKVNNPQADILRRKLMNSF